MSKGKLLKERQYLFIGIFVVLALLLVFIINLIYQTDNISEDKSLAGEQFEEWNFVIINDTHSKDFELFDAYYQAIANQNPKMVIHLGDLGWNQNGNRIYWGDYRYQPLKGMIDIQYRRLGMDDSLPFTEIHIAPGNHDVKKVRTIDKDTPQRHNIYTLLPGDHDIACEGRYPYWGNAGEEFSTHFTPSVGEQGYENIQKKDGFEPFNRDIVDSRYCDDDDFSSVYQFERGGIRFVLFGYDINDNMGVERKFDELRNVVCNYDGNAPTILLNHDGHRDVATMVKLDCPSKVNVMFNGHTHYEKKEMYGEIPLFSEIGILFTSSGADVGKDDTMLVVNVKKNKVTFTRWRNLNRSTLQPQSKEVIFELKGSFSSYENPHLVASEIALREPHNLISMPTGSIAEFIRKLRAEEVNARLSYYDSGRWNIISEDSVPDLPPGVGIYAGLGDDNILVEVMGKRENFDFANAAKGWNLIGISDFESAKEFLERINTGEYNVSIISDYRQKGFKNLVYVGGQFFGEDFSIDSSRAYFVFIK